MKKRVLTVLLILALALSVMPSAFAAGGFDNFKKINSYKDGQFTDVPSDKWFAVSVKTGYELGLINGSSATTYTPAGNMTLAEAVTLASRLHSIYTTGSAKFEQGTPWYQTYVDYAIANGIIKEGEYANYTKDATRAQCAVIFAASLPKDAFTKINDIKLGDIPDVKGTEAYADAVYTLYNAGILTGSDEYGTFNPKSNIQRSEIAAIVTRIADVSLRKTFKLRVYIPLDIVGVSYQYDEFFKDYLVFVEIKNIGDVAVDAFEFRSYVYDAYGNPVNHLTLGSNVLNGTWDNTVDKALKPGTTLTDTYWKYSGFETLKILDIAITKVHTVDGRTYDLTGDQYYWHTFVW